MSFREKTFRHTRYFSVDGNRREDMDHFFLPLIVSKSGAASHSDFLRPPTPTPIPSTLSLESLSESVSDTSSSSSTTDEEEKEFKEVVVYKKRVPCKKTERDNGITAHRVNLEQNGVAVKEIAKAKKEELERGKVKRGKKVDKKEKKAKKKQKNEKVKREKNSKETKKKRAVKPVYSSVFPTNESAAQEEFFSGEDRKDPKFVYGNLKKCRRIVSEYAIPRTEYLEEAKRILKTVLRLYGSESAYLSEAGIILPFEESIPVFEKFMEDHSLNCKISFVEDSASPTSMKKDTLCIRVPTEYRQHSIHGVANHELGTHYIRRLNERMQVWNGKRDVYNLKQWIETEEGLACLHTHLSCPTRFLWKAALHYYACCRAAELSFSELFEEMSEFIDRPDRVWKECIRVKRGLCDTSQPGCFCKDQVYLTGAINILRQRKELDFKLLYSGKLCLEDMEKVKDVVDIENIILPNFMKNLNAYMMELDELARINMIN